jgi:WD40 repeat protein
VRAPAGTRARDGFLRRRFVRLFLEERGALYSRATGAAVAEIAVGHSALTRAVFSYDGSALVVRNGHEMRVFNGRSGEPLSRLCGTTSGPNAIRVSANGAYVATQQYGVANSQVVAVWRVASGAIVARLRAPYSSLKAQDIRSSADLLATGAEDGRVRIWRLARGPGPIPLIGPSLTR